jgi:hypothetical protein
VAPTGQRVRSGVRDPCRCQACIAPTSTGSASTESASASVG